jgi:predicted metal-dependent hydrolase
MAAAPIVRSDRVQLGERAVAFKLFRVPRRRHVHVMVNDDGHLEVRAPWRFSVDEARAAIQEHRGWVLGALDETRSRVRMRPRLVSGCELPLLDDHLRLRVRMQAQLSLFAAEGEGGGHLGLVQRQGRELRVEVRAAQPSAVRRLLENWYRGQAAALLPPRLEPMARALEVCVPRVSIRSQRTRWGSCSSRGTLSLNWRLTLLPARLCDYVLAHELAHLREMNHSPAFWALVQGLVPDYRDRRRELEQRARMLPL